MFKFMEFTFPGNASILIRGIFTHALPHSKLAPNSCHYALGRRKLRILPGSILSKISFLQQQKGVGETMICFIKYIEDNLGH